ncbi:hypothetical protein [Spirochaeta isovalerica]|uniref:Uncharacterized protein n=1 Tax=Spirochaeta isovalerica TaxID=150 RepID=A0A841RG42_9SPIO|nr:hypothetical protein [Spirochaeta isovalerica]MBB6481508.1 hypothetical protein [Spirochaeta isovalerica]
MLAAFIPMSDWLPMQFTNNETGEKDQNKITLMTGGQTTAMNIRFEKKDLLSIPEIGSFHNPENLVYELTEESVITKNNADLTVLRINEEQDNPFTFSLTLYDFEESVEYKISYFYNISQINLNYDIWEHLKAIVLYTSFLSYLEK